MPIIRPANKQDKNIIAKLMVIASGGLCEYFLSDIATRLTPAQLLAYEIAKCNSPLSYHNCLVAEEESKVIGVLCCYSAAYLAQHLNNSLSKEKLAIIKPCYVLESTDSLYIDTLCVDSEYQGKQTGKKLLAGVRCFLSFYQDLLLYVWSRNDKAINLYQQFGFKTIKAISINVPEFIEQQPRLLMHCDKTTFLKNCI
jgi:ribosomal protein S18 acetylase RimI-like enzyme